MFDWTTPQTGFWVFPFQPYYPCPCGDIPGSWNAIRELLGSNRRHNEGGQQVHLLLDSVPSPLPIFFSLSMHVEAFVRGKLLYEAHAYLLSTLLACVPFSPSPWLC